MSQPHKQPGQPGAEPPSRNVFVRFQKGFERRFDQTRERYGALLEQAIAHRGRFVLISLAIALGSLPLFFFLGRDYFPEIRSGVIQMNMRAPVWDYRQLLRKGLKERYPGTEFTFQPSDLTAKILNFGAPAPIDVQVNGPEMYPNYEFARKLASKLRDIPGATDVVIQQTMRTPTLMVEGNRTFGLGVNRTLKDMADNLLMTTAGSQQVDQIYWLDPSTSMSYLINVYTPQPQINRINSLRTIPIDSSDNAVKDDIQ